MNPTVIGANVEGCEHTSNATGTPLQESDSDKGHQLKYGALYFSKSIEENEMKHLILSCTLLALALTSTAQKQPPTTKRDAFYPSSLYNVIPHITTGSNWTSKFVLFNVGTENTPYRLEFFDAAGKSTGIPLVGMGTPSEVYGFLNPGGSVWFETPPNNKPTETQYWARLTEGEGKIQGFVIFSWSVPGNTPMEVTVPMTNEWILDNEYFPFNNTNGYKTALAITNTANEYSFYDAENIIFEALNENGNLIYSGTITLNPGQKTAFLLPDQINQLQNQKGTIRLRNGTGYHFSYLVLQFNPAGSVTLVVPFDEY